MSMPVALVFDAYGTLFDVHGVSALAETLAPRQGDALAQLWRTKQLEYSWQSALLTTASRPRPDFRAVTTAALDYAVAALIAPLDADARRRLVDAYLELPAHPDARAALDQLAPRPRVILSNGTLAMLEPLVRAAGLDDAIDAILSVDAAGTYKPAPAVYQLAVDHLRLAPARIGFVSANGWDAGGAKAFGFTTFWINRAGMPVERIMPDPDYVVASLADVARIVAG